MVVVGEVGYVDPVGGVAFPIGNTFMNVSDKATADGYLTKIKIHRTSGGTLKVSSWKNEFSPPPMPFPYYGRQDFVLVTVPSGSGVVEISLPTDLEFKTGWYVGYYSGDVTLLGGGGVGHKSARDSGDVSYLGMVSPPPDSPTLWGKLDDLVPPILIRPFFRGKI